MRAADIRHKITLFLPALLALVLVMGCSTTQDKLFNAASEGDAGMVKALLEKGADVNARNGEGDTPLILAARNGHAETVSALLESEADPDMTDAAGDTAIIIASTRGHIDTVKALIEWGACMFTESLTSGMAPLAAAEKSGHEEIAAVLRESGAE